MENSQIIKALNSDLAEELGSMVQYTRHGRAAEETRTLPVAEVFGRAAAEETRHAERLAERIFQLGGEPTTEPRWNYRGDSPGQVTEDHLAAERQAIRQYRLHIRLCVDLVDPVTRLMLEEILTDEERQAYDLERVLCAQADAKQLLAEWERSCSMLLEPGDREVPVGAVEEVHN